MYHRPELIFFCGDSVWPQEASRVVKWSSGVLVIFVTHSMVGQLLNGEWENPHPDKNLLRVCFEGFYCRRSGAPERMGAKGNIIKTSTLFKNINKTSVIYQQNINKLLT